MLHLFALLIVNFLGDTFTQDQSVSLLLVDTLLLLLIQSQDNLASAS